MELYGITWNSEQTTRCEGRATWHNKNANENVDENYL